jgi:hypothetical protein
MKNEKNRLSSFELEMLFGSVRYFLGRNTAVAAYFPNGIATNYYSRLSIDQKRGLLKDMVNKLKEYDDGQYPYYLYHWYKLAACLDINKHKFVNVENYIMPEDSFLFDGEYILTNSYIDNPFEGEVIT